MSLRLGIVVPCYNEEDVFPETVKRLLALLERLASTGLVTPDSAIYFVDDGSKDCTWALIEEAAISSARVHGIKLSRNQGHQSALIAGLFGAEGDALISIDADLQDDLNVIEEMIRKHREGYEIVYGVRKSRTTDTFFKKSSAEIYYKLLSRMGVAIVHNHADYRLMGRRSLNALDGYSEVNLFLRGIVPLLGFRTATAFYDRSERFAGESKYPLKKMLGLAINGITSFSIVPLRMISMLGFLVSLFSVVMVGWVIYGKVFMNSAIPGWASSVIPIYILGGIQLLSIGVLGEYISKIYLETKRRPRYIIEKVI